MEAFSTQNNRSIFDNTGFRNDKKFVCCLESFDVCDFNGYVYIDFIEQTLTNKCYDLAIISFSS